MFKVGFCGSEFGEEALFGLELAGVNAATARLDADGMFEVEHLVVEEVLDGAARSVGAVEDAADDDGVVGGVVVAQHAAGVVGAPGEGGAAEEAVEETDVEGVEDLVEIVVMADVREDALAATGLADVLGLFGDGFGGDVAAIAVSVGRRYRFFVELGEQDVCDGVEHTVGCTFQQVRETHQQPAFAEADRVVHIGKGEEFDGQFRNGRARPQFAVGFMEDL